MATLTTETDGPILWIRLDRPDAMNAYNADMGAELTAAFRRASAEDAIRVVVLTAKGRVFCAGADVSAGAGAFDTNAGDGAGNFGAGQDGDFVQAMMDCTKPSIVAFNGSAAGVGLTMALPCDIRIAAETAKFGFVFARRGLVPEAGSAWFLPRLVGMAQALNWCLTGRLFPASEALAKGLVSETCPAERAGIPRSRARPRNRRKLRPRFTGPHPPHALALRQRGLARRRPRRRCPAQHRARPARRRP